MCKDKRERIIRTHTRRVVVLVEEAERQNMLELLWDMREFNISPEEMLDAIEDYGKK